MHHNECCTGPKWRVHPHMHRNTPHAYFGPAQTPPWSLDPFALKTCSQHTAPPRARASLGRASNLSPIKMHHVERCTGPEWRAHAHARRNAPHACVGHAKSVPRALCSHMVLAMAPLIARATHRNSSLTTSRPSKCAMSSRVWARSGCTREFIPYACFGHYSHTHAGIPLHSRMLATRHHRQRA